jgi:phosphoglycolate phosphatase
VIEVMHPGATAASAKAVIFDFDGTLSLIRSGWMDIMVPLCVEQLSALKTNESSEQLHGIVEEFIWRLTGKETIYQMMALADAIRERGGHPLTPLEYKKMYLDRLWLHISNRVEGLRSRSLEPDRLLVPGARSLLEHLTDRGLLLYLASGTDDANVKEEAGLLGIASFFQGGIYGAQDDLNRFSKALLVQQILSKTTVRRPDELLVFGDGYVEIEEVSKAGGVAVGVATSEPECLTVDSWKRERLIRAGADFIVPNFLQLSELAGAVLQGAALVEID